MSQLPCEEGVRFKYFVPWPEISATEMEPLSSLTLKTAATTGEINAVNSSIMKPLRQPVSVC